MAGLSRDDYQFITLTTGKRRRIFLTQEFVTPLESALCHYIENSDVTVGGYVIMPDHVHMLVAPDVTDIPRFVKNFKSYTGIKVKKIEPFSGSVWRAKFYSMPVETQEEFSLRIRLMHKNPVKGGLVKRALDYPWSSYRAYRGLDARAPVTVEELVEIVQQKREKSPRQLTDIVVKKYFRTKKI